MTVNFLSCSGFGCSPVRMISGLLHASKSPNWFQFGGSDVIFTYQGRYAIALLCELLRIGPGDEVIMPAYNCGAEVDPFVWAGAKVVLYRVDNKGIIDIEDIMQRVTSSTRVIYITHFFGWPQDIGALAAWCKNKGLYLIEDCALSLFSKGPSNAIGQIGDAAIYSFVKSLPVPDGGALVLNRTRWNENKRFKTPLYSNTFRNCLPLLKKWFMHTNKLWAHYEFTRNILAKSWLKQPIDQKCEMYPEMPLSNYFDHKKKDWSISRLSKGILHMANPVKLVEIRRRNYQYLHNALCNIPSIQLLFDDLPDDVCPLSFPFFVNDRNRCCNALEDKGILVGGWPSYHRGFDWKEFPEARHLKNDLLTLPVHQSLDVQHMEYIAECVKSIAEKNDNYHSR